MKSTNPSSQSIELFTQIFVKHVHYLINVGFLFAQNEISSDNEEETAITGFIKRGIKINLRKADFPKWGKFYAVSEEEPVDYDDKKGKSRPRIDILIETTVGTRPEFYFEAKRLKTSTHPVSKYIGDDGLMCFINGIYAAEYNDAGMLGYIQNKSEDHWKEKIQTEIKENSDKLSLKDNQEEIKINDQFPKEWFSKHGRKTITRDIKIYHILLDFSKNS